MRQTFAPTSSAKSEVDENEELNLIALLPDVIAKGTVDDLDEVVQHIGGYNLVRDLDLNLMYYAALNQKVVIFKHLISKGFTVDEVIPELKMPVYEFIINMKSTPQRDRLLRIAYETSERMLEDYYRPRYRKSGWQAEAVEAMKTNDFIMIDRLLNRHSAHTDNVMLDEGLFIHSAILNDCSECVRLILDKGADPNHPYVGSAALNGCAFGTKQKIIKNWTPLMMAVAKGNMRVIDALLESPKIEVTKGLPSEEFHTARALARHYPESDLKIEILKKLRARPADKQKLESWIEGVALKDLSMIFALGRKNRKWVEFLLHNVDKEINPEWLQYAVKHSNAECLKILMQEYAKPIDSLKLGEYLVLSTFDTEKKRKLIADVDES